MRRKSITFRAEGDTDSNLIQLLSLEQERADKLGHPTVCRSDILNAAVRYYYFYRMNLQDEDPVTENVMKAMERVARKNNQVMVNSMNAMHYEVLVAVEYLRLLCKALNFDNTKDGLDVLLNTEMPWDIAIPEKVNMELSMKEEKDGQC